LSHSNTTFTLVWFSLNPVRQFHVATPAQIGLMLTQPLPPLHSTIKQAFLKELLVKHRTKTIYTQSLPFLASFYSAQSPLISEFLFPFSCSECHLCYIIMVGFMPCATCSLSTSTFLPLPIPQHGLSDQVSHFFYVVY